MLVRASFPPEAASAPAARRFTERTLAQWGMDDLMDTARLLVSELVINAVLHAGTAAEVVLRTSGGRLRVEVSDRSRELPEVKDHTPSAPTGRGLVIVERLAEDWGVELDPGGKTVWFELASTPVGVSADGGHATASPDRR